MDYKIAVDCLLNISVLTLWKELHAEKNQVPLVDIPFGTSI